MSEYFEPAPHQSRAWWLDGGTEATSRATVNASALLRGAGLQARRVAAQVQALWTAHQALRSRLELASGFAVPLLRVDAVAQPQLVFVDAGSMPEAQAGAQFSAACDTADEATASGEWAQGGAVLMQHPGDAVSLSLHHHAESVDAESLLHLFEDLVLGLAGLPFRDSMPFVDVAGWLQATMPEFTVPQPAATGGRRRAWATACRVPKDSLAAAFNGAGIEAVVLAAAAAVEVRLRANPELDVERCLPLRPVVGSGALVGALGVPSPLPVCVDADTRFADLVAMIDAELRRPAELATLQLKAAPAALACVFASAPAAVQAGGFSAELLRWQAAPSGAAWAVACLDAGRELWLQPSLEDLRNDIVPMHVLSAALDAVLAAVVAEPGAQVLSLPLTRGDLSRQAASSAGPAVTWPGGSFPELFKRVCTSMPDRLAGRCRAQSWSYQQLDAASDAVARLIADAGVPRGGVVALLMRRSLGLVAGMLGTLKAGVAFLPLDTAAPDRRLNFMLDDTDARLVICEPSLAGHPSLQARQVRVFDDTAPVQVSAPQALIPVDGDDLAYVLFTSGSTGEPKAVELTHRGLANYLQFAAEAYRLDEGRGAIVQSPATFDLTLTSLLAPLTVGQSLILIEDDVDGHGAGAQIESVRDELLAGHVTLLKTTPSYLRLINALLSPGECKGPLGSLVIGGEMLSWDLVEPWLQQSPRTRVFNEYGPTETVVGSICHALQASDPRQGWVPIGKPIANTDIFVLDAQGRPVPTGVFGEICIGGSGVGLGYRKRPALSAARFVRPPWRGPGASMLYRTGDRGRLLPSGAVELAGRMDNQLKVQGIRIEPGEIEAVMLAQPGITGAVVMKAEQEGSESLAAWVTGTVDEPMLLEALRQRLQDTLPVSLVPATIVQVSDFPLTPNGKLDRAALRKVPTLAALHGRRVRQREAPRNKAEAELARIWCQVLGVTEVGVEDDFFDLGGDSIRSIAVVGEARARGLHVTVAQIFQERTVRALARLCGGPDPVQEAPLQAFELVTDADRARLPPGLVDAYPMTTLQLAMIYHNERGEDDALYHDIFSYQLRFAPDLDLLRQASRQLVAQYEVLRTTFDLITYGHPLQLVHRDGPDILVVQDLRGLSAEEQQRTVDAYVAAEKGRRFDVGALPMMRLMLHRRSDAEVQLTMSFHHALIDGWSDVVLLTGLFEIYFALVAGRAPAPAPETRFVEFVRLEQQALAHVPTRDFWRQQLEGFRFVPLPRSAVAGASGVKVLGVPVSAATSERLKALALAHSLPVKSLLFAVHLKIMALLRGDGDVATSIVLSGRPETADGDRMVGLFINSVPVRVRLEPSTWIGLARLAFERESALLPHRRLPFAEIKRLVGDQPVSETLFYFTNYYIARRLHDHGVELLSLRGHEASSFKLVANFWIEPFSQEIRASVAVDSAVVDEALQARIAGYYERALSLMTLDPDSPHLHAALLAPEEATGDAPLPPRADLLTEDRRILQRAARSPAHVALRHGQQKLDYAGLARRSALCARRLRQRGVSAGDRVALCATLDVDFVVALLGILRCGAVYVPLALNQPAARLRLICDDAQPVAIVVDARGAGIVADPARQLDLATLAADGDAGDPAGSDTASDSRLDALAYLSYTSGSTGVPKGVAVSHRALASFCTAMHPVLARDQPGVWLAATSVGFDISVLELVWTLGAGYTVVLHDDTQALLPPAALPMPVPAGNAIDFSLFFFASEAGLPAYQTLLDCAKRADALGFSAIWTPERHFHAFGGPFPNPAITSAALAMVTKRLQIRAGSLVMPLHHPVRVAEDWAMVDQLSGGRVGLSVASGWHPGDFVLSSKPHAQRREVTAAGIQILRSLWRGETVQLEDAEGGSHAISTLPRPVQSELPLWLSAAGAPETFELAGRLGCGVLTHLLSQDADGLARNIERYRLASRQKTQVTLMLHSYVAATKAQAEDVAREPLRRYLSSSVDLARTIGANVDSAVVTEADRQALFDRATERYLQGASLIGSMDDAVELARDFHRRGVDEIACLIDFGIDGQRVRDNLEQLDEVRARASAPARSAVDDSIAGLIERHGVTHFQCTPTLLRELMANPRTQRALSRLEVLLVGGEALPPALAARVRESSRTRLLNMYGPTEATIWASFDEIGDDAPTLGRALDNSSLYVLDAEGQAAPFLVEGEIHIGGACLAEGYWQNEALTRAAFVASPVPGHGGRTLYRTGDAAMRLPDGRLKFLGRKDRQVKISGQRIELGEIEQVLGGHAAVADCAVLLDEGRLVAAVVTAPGQTHDPQSLRRFALDRLPTAMVPHTFFVTESLPRTPNGKLDEPALRTAARSGAGIGTVASTPRAPQAATPADALEARIGQLWQASLGAAPSDADADFFQSGGNSLKAMLFATYLRDAFGAGITVRSVFEHASPRALAALLRGAQSPAAEVRAAAAPAAEAVPLGFSQSRLWMLARLAPDSVAYNDAMLVEMTGALDLDTLRGAVRTVMGRHESLRSRFFDEAGVGRVRYSDSLEFEFEALDMASASPQEAFETALQLARTAARRRFDLEHGPLLRLFVARIARDRHLVLLAVHHIVCDGWSLAVFMHEVAALYTRPQVPLPAVKLRYADFVRRQRDRLTPEVRAQQFGYWREQLADLPAPFELPLDFARPAVQSYTGAIERASVPMELTRALDALAGRQRATLYMVLLSALAVVLSRISGRSDLVIGADTANRLSPDVENMIGLLVNQIALRIDLDGSPTYAELLERTRNVALGAYDHQDLPFQQIVNELCPERDAGRNPIFQVAFTLQQAPDFSAVSSPAMRLGAVPFDVGVARLDLEVNAHRSAEGLSIAATYNELLFRPATIARVLKSLLSVLADVVADPTRPVSELTLFGSDERRLLLEQFNRSEAAYDRRPLMELLEEGARRTPAQLAVVGPAGTLSYAELQARVEVLAARLHASGIGEGAIVAVISERDAPLLLAVLALWRLNAVYLPLDPYSPPKRTAQLLAEVQCRWVLHSAACAATALEAVETITGPSLPARLRIDDADGSDGAASIDRLAAAPRRPYAPDAPAYVIFTSGSTGRPKGAIVNHAGMMNHLQAKIADLALTAADCVAQTAPQTFDISVWQMLAAIAVGGRVRFYDDEVAQNPRVLIETVDGDGITVLQVVPSFLDLAIVAAMSSGASRLFGSLRWLISTGEALSVALCRRWFAIFPGIPLMNAYGPAECSDDVTHHVIDRMPEETEVSIPIGRPIGNARIYVLDEHLQPVPIGAAGELCVSGVCVGGGYLGNPQATQLKFLEDPHARGTGQRLYRTGDLARWRPDGVLDYLGRIDNQVKIRGCRIELGEVEAVLQDDELVRQSVVVAAGNPDLRLIGYVMPDWRAVESFVADRENRERTEEWKSIYEFYYQEAPPEATDAAGQSVVDPTLDIRGWVDSFTSKAIPTVEMQSWVDQTVARIRALRRRRILEVGCGTGMLLFRLAAGCERYRGIDLSPAVVGQLQSSLSTLYPQWTHVEVSQQAAHELDQLDEDGFDCVIVNSVVQYFPSEAYLQGVLQAACRKLARGGCIFLGDIRALEVLPDFHHALVLATSDDSLPLADMRQRARNAVSREKELLLSNRYFDGLCGPEQPLGRAVGVRKWLKSGPYDNELVRYRLDVALMLDEGPAQSARILEWTDPGGSGLESLSRRLAALGGQAIVVTGIPNVRLATDERTQTWLSADEPPETVGELRALLAMNPVSAPVSPDDLVAHLGQQGYRVQTSFSSLPDHRWSLDLLVSRSDTSWPLLAAANAPTSNNPLRNRAQQALLQRLRRNLSDRLPPFMIPNTLALVDDFPLLRSGKINRHALPAVETHTAEEEQGRPRTQAEKVLCRIWAELLGVDSVGIRANFFALGGDSILAIQMVSLAARQGFKLQTRQVFRHQTVAELAAAAVPHEEHDRKADEILEGPFPLSPIQAAFFESQPANPDHFNQAILLQCRLKMTAAQLDRALHALARRHDALRLRFVGEAQAWHQVYRADEAAQAIELAVLDQGDRSGLVRVGSQLQSSLSIRQGPLLRAAWLPGIDGGPDTILLIAHHLIIDAVSWRILIEDLEELLQASLASRAPALPAKTASYRDWVERQVALAESHALRDQWSFWIEQARVGTPHPIAGRAAPDAPADMPDQVITETLSAALSARLVQNEGGQPGLSVEELLIVALVFALRRQFGKNDVVLLNEGHGRDTFDDLDVSRTVGWFTTAYPMLLRANPGIDPSRQIDSLADQIRFAKHRQSVFGVLKCFSPDSEVRRALTELTPPEIAFNYFGRISAGTARDSSLQWVVGDTGPVSDARNRRVCAVQLDVVRLDDDFKLQWSVDPSRLDPEVIRPLSAAVAAELQFVLENASHEGHRQAVTADPRFVSLDSDDLGAALSEIDGD